jgi:hypothetical protein
MLELISSRNCPICSLKVVNWSYGSLPTSSFQNINLSQLQRLELSGLQPSQYKAIMDSALQSNTDGIILHIKFCPVTLDLFRHELLQRVIEIEVQQCSFLITCTGIDTNVRCIATHGVDSVQELPVLEDISFPSIRTWRIHSKTHLFSLYDFSTANSIHFFSTNYPMDRFLAPIPTQLTTLQLKNVVFTPNSLPTGQRHSLPCLTTLLFENVVLSGPMRRYFYCPRLERLYYLITFDELVINTTIEGCKDPYKLPVHQTIDETFCKEMSALVDVSLRGTTMDDALRSTLASCPHLNILEIQDCRIEKFIGPFLENLQDTKYFPSLGRLIINDSWPAKPDILYEEFMAQCSSKRPSIYISGNGREEPLYVSDDDDEEEEEDDEDEDYDDDDWYE